MDTPQRKGRLAVIARRRGKTVDEIVPESVAQAGSIMGAAQLLGVSPNTIRHHLKRMGYRPQYQQTVVWVKDAS